MPIGTKVVIHLKDKEKGNFGNKYNLERLIKKYSNFVGFPIAVDGDRANKIEALWAQPASQITQEQHNEFYRFIANAFDTPRYQFQFAADAPLSIQCLLYVPQVRRSLSLAVSRCQARLAAVLTERYFTSLLVARCCPPHCA